MDPTAINNETRPPLTLAQDIKLRNVAKQFEALLLTQLTSTMNNIGSGEDTLFGKDGGADLAKKLFSEQLATAMADSGGIGIAEMMLKELGIDPKSKVSTKPYAAVDKANVRNDANIRSDQTEEVLINRSNPSRPVINQVSASNELAIVSTDSGNSAAADDSWRTAFESPSNGVDFTKPENMLSAKAKPTGYMMPVEGRISSRFGNRFHPIDKQQKFHSGIDIAVPRGTPIKAAADGEVVFAGRRGGYGNLVVIEHSDGKMTRYAHADSINVEKGQSVRAGENIATVGSTGKATGPHLHFEVRENGKPVNPFGLIAKVSVGVSDK